MYICIWKYVVSVTVREPYPSKAIILLVLSLFLLTKSVPLFHSFPSLSLFLSLPFLHLFFLLNSVPYLIFLSFCLDYSLSAHCSVNYLFLVSVYRSLYFTSTVCIYFSFSLSKFLSSPSSFFSQCVHVFMLRRLLLHKY